MRRDASGRPGGLDPEPCVRSRGDGADRLRAHQRGVGHDPSTSTSVTDELDDRELIHGAIEGMTQAVGDTGHTDFMTPEEREARNDALSGSYVGIGVRIDLTEDGLPGS